MTEIERERASLEAWRKRIAVKDARWEARIEAMAKKTRKPRKKVGAE